MKRTKISKKGRDWPIKKHCHRKVIGDTKPTQVQIDVLSQGKDKESPSFAQTTTVKSSPMYADDDIYLENYLSGSHGLVVMGGGSCFQRS